MTHLTFRRAARRAVKVSDKGTQGVTPPTRGGRQRSDGMRAVQRASKRGSDGEVLINDVGLLDSFGGALVDDLTGFYDVVPVGELQRRLEVLLD